MTGLDTSTPVVVLAPAVRLGVGHGIARSLGRLGVPVYGVHTNPSAAAARSRYWRQNFRWDFRSAAPAETVERLLEVARQLPGRPILIAADDSSCLLVADYAEALSHAYTFPAQPPGLARMLSSKQSMFELCRREGVPTPNTFFPQSRDDVAGLLDDLTFPVMLKGIDTFALYLRSGIRMTLVHDAPTLLRLYDELETPGSPNLMIQEHIPGGSEQVWMFNGYFDSESRCRFGITGQKLRQYPADKGVTSLGVCIGNHAVHERTTQLMQALGYRGVLDIGYKLDARTGEYLLLDVNPRVGVSFRLFVDSLGMDVVRALYFDLTSQRVEAGSAREGRKWMVENFDLVTALTYMRSGRLSPAGWARSLRGVEEASWFAADDPGPMLRMLQESVAWMLKAGRNAEPTLSPQLEPLSVESA